MHKRPNHFYEFGPFRLDTTERILLRDGVPVSLTPKALETLIVLVENSGHIVEKDALMKQVWPDAFVEEAGLTLNISVLRKILNSGQEEEQYIQTLPRRGYRFTAAVRELTEGANETVVEHHTRLRITTEEEITKTGREGYFSVKPGSLIRSRPAIGALAILILVVAGATVYLWASSRAINVRVALREGCHLWQARRPGAVVEMARKSG